MGMRGLDVVKHEYAWGENTTSESGGADVERVECLEETSFMHVKDFKQLQVQAGHGERSG
jgi:hypothetical protein